MIKCPTINEEKNKYVIKTETFESIWQKENTDKESSLNNPTLCKPFLYLPQNKEQFHYS